MKNIVISLSFILALSSCASKVGQSQETNREPSQVKYKKPAPPATPPKNPPPNKYYRCTSNYVNPSHIPAHEILIKETPIAGFNYSYSESELSFQYHFIPMNSGLKEYTYDIKINKKLYPQPFQAGAVDRIGKGSYSNQLVPVIVEKGPSKKILYGSIMLSKNSLYSEVTEPDVSFTLENEILSNPLTCLEDLSR